MTRAGQLRYSATIQKPTYSQDTVGGPQTAWSTHLTVWGNILPMTTRWSERYIAQQEVAQAHGIFEMRYQESHGINPTMRISVDSRTLEIVYVADPDGRRRDLHLFYREVQA
jgi:SPP1 family predicted phage head-tail adaptor